jgi:hypothetical protein
MTKANKHEPDDGQVDLSFDQYEETVVSVGENESEEKEPVIDVSEEKADSGDEHEEYSTSVKKRIDRLTKKMREAERRETEAIKYAQNVQAESQQIKSRLQTVDQGYMTEYGNRLNIEQKQVEDTLKDAMDKGDTGAAVAAQRKLTQLAVSADRYTSVQNNRKQQVAQAAAQKQQPQQPVQQPQPVEQPPDPKAEKWAENNNWFGKDEAMTFAAFGIHKGMVEKEGFDPQSDDYYDELDSRIRNKFPQEFNGSGKRPVQNVAGNSRSRGRTSGRSRKVKLTPSQVAIAHKLGVPLEEYAKYVKT